MTKKKAATKKTIKPSLIVFGNLDGKQRAGTFAEVDAELAKKAATELSLSIREVNDKATRDIAAKLRPGNAHANASGFLPVAPKAIYGKLTVGAAGMAKGKDSEPHLPKSFQDIRIGSAVASQDTDPQDGMWLAVVTKQKGDMFTLRWKSPSERPAFTKHRFNLALLWPGEDLVVGPDDVTSETYPANWAAINLNMIVGAMEDGPIGQIWEATVIEATGPNTFRLEWRGFPDAPAIERPRRSLALMYPNPGAIKRNKKS